MTYLRRSLLLLVVLGLAPGLAAQTGNQPPALLSDLVDVSRDFRDYSNGFFLADRLTAFDPAAGTGRLVWRRHQLSPRIAFDNMLAVLRPFEGVTFPENEYAIDPELAFSIEFVTPRTVRLRWKTGPEARADGPSLMLAGPVPRDSSWRMMKIDGGYLYASSAGSVTVFEKPWRVEFRDARGRLLTKTNHSADLPATLVPALPFSFIRRSSDYSRSVAASFYLSAGEKLFGCGESFTRLDKRGQKVVLWANDANGVETERMYKPIPFFMSSRGYGMFVHSSTPMTFDMGASFHAANNLLVGDDELDLFVFLGEPKDILDEYTKITGKAAMPPLWSFGLWMSRITYTSEEEVRSVAAKLRQHRIPDDVIHIDTGWFETDWRCDYQFSKTRFKDPAKMIGDLKQDGFRISLWQLPYFVPKNALFPEIVRRGLYVRDPKGNLPYEDAVLDFSNPEAVKWYQDKIGALIGMGVGAIKVDFGEAAPLTGVYASGRTGFFEHNLYPLRYNQAVADITKQLSGENIIWARSAWAGSQRYPLHWGGDSGTLDQSMLSQLRGGLSFGLSGFTFWSHDIGGFAASTPEDLYRRWLPFGMLSSHSRAHGMPPKEPWEYGVPFTDAFRRAVDLKYTLMPYVYAQARDGADRGLPMVRALFVEYPSDPGSWMVEDEYLFGSDILVAPLFEAAATGRGVYLPPGQWIDYQTGKVYAGGWHAIQAGAIPVVMLVRDGAIVPHIKLAQSTRDMNWKDLDLVVYATGGKAAVGLVCLPSDNVLHRVELPRAAGGYRLAKNPLEGKSVLAVQPYTARPVQASPAAWKLSPSTAPVDGTGAYATGKYRDLFAESGRSKAEIDAKIQKAYEQLFHGNPETERLYTPAGRNADGPLAYIPDIQHTDVRSEGMSYGMMIAVQLDKKEEFDALWNWSMTHMYQKDPKHPSYGYFSWQMSYDGTVMDELPAPDGEEYYVMALYFADNRWGSGKGIYDYKACADRLLRDMAHRRPITGMVRQRGGVRQHTVGKEVNDEYGMILFSPDERNNMTDASYHLPAFYELWARWGPKEDRAFWTRAAEVSRDYFVRNTHPKTGLAPNLGQFDGTPLGFRGPASAAFREDAWRVAMNWSVDWSWWAKDPRQRELSDRIQAFFEGQGMEAYGDNWNLDGAVIRDRHSPGLVATNGAASIAATDRERARKFLDALWNLEVPSSTVFRYYDGLLYLMGLMHASGRFQIIRPRV